MSRAKDLNAPENWLAWLRATQKDPHSPCEARGSLGMITGTDARALRAIAAAWALCSHYDGDPVHLAGLAAVRAILPTLQRSCWPFARELIAQSLEWHTRDRLWPLVVSDEDDLLHVQIRAASAAEMLRALETVIAEYRIEAHAERELARRPA